MKCVTCSTEIESSMRHAISINSCPFCGRNIFSAGEYEFRKSVQRILIKNGLDDEKMMNGIVDDITTILGEQYTRDKEPAQVEEEPKPVAKKVQPSSDVSIKKPIQTQRRVASQEEIEEAMAAEEEAAHDPDLAPARQLTPDPRRANQTAKPMTNADKVALAMREFEASQKIEDEPEYSEDEEDGQEEFFTTEKVPSSEVERMKRIAAERVRLVQETSGFKNKPIQRRGME